MGEKPLASRVQIMTSLMPSDSGRPRASFPPSCSDVVSCERVIDRSRICVYRRRHNVGAENPLNVCSVVYLMTHDRRASRMLESFVDLDLTPQPPVVVAKYVRHTTSPLSSSAHGHRRTSRGEVLLGTDAPTGRPGQVARPNSDAPCDAARGRPLACSRAAVDSAPVDGGRPPRGRA